MTLCGNCRESHHNLTHKTALTKKKPKIIKWEKRRGLAPTFRYIFNNALALHQIKRK